MTDTICEKCGGCVFRSLSEQRYREEKERDFRRTIGFIKDAAPVFDAPIFIADGMRRRADLAFVCHKKEIKIGFNEANTHNLIPLKTCPMLDSQINDILPDLYILLEQLCAVNCVTKSKKKITTARMSQGSIKILHADNGISLVIETDIEPVLEHRLTIADFVNAHEKVCRLSWKAGTKEPEIITAKHAPEIYIADCTVEIPEGVFLQASKAAEQKMIEKVLEYLGTTTGKIADLFCGIGTFTYPLARIKGNEIISVDSYEPSLKGLKKAINGNQLHNVRIIQKNLFKYPLDATDLKGLSALVIDPPRAGAHEQCREIAQAPIEFRPQKIVFVSCNPKTFIYDADTLIQSGYVLERVTLVDQFVYSKHQELVSLFTYNPQK